MVKSLRICWTCLKRLFLIGTIVVMALAFWLHGNERSLEFAKPWIVKAVNSDDAPYVITIGDVTIDWTDAASLGKMRIKSVAFAKRDGNVFAQLPEVYVTIDPVGFLPFRRLLHRVIIHSPHMSATRNADGDVELGFEDSPSKLPMAELLAFFADGKDTKEPTALEAPNLPFHQLIIDNAALTFVDVKSGTTIVSKPVDIEVWRHYGSFQAGANLPFTIDDHPAKMRVDLTGLKEEAHKLTVRMTGMPSRLVCLFDTCPDKVKSEGAVDGAVSLTIAQDMTLHQFHAVLQFPKLTFTAPQWFAEPLKFTDSNLIVDGDWSTQLIGITQSKLQMEDVTASITGTAQQKADGWYVTGSGEAGHLEVNKIYKYWPIFLAPDSRAWITAKLKSGYASKGTLKVNFIPIDITGSGVRDESVDAIADAHEVGFEYLPGFPPVDKMDGTAHFTGKTVRVEGSNGSLMSGGVINHAVLWCPQLDNPKNPMEVELNVTAPAADAATILALKYFTFDDALGLDPKTIGGTIDSTMKLKFDAFSSNAHAADPSYINLGAVTYDIVAKLSDVKQEKLAGSYNLRAINGNLKATNAGMNFDGTLALGDAGTNAIKLQQQSGKSLNLQVKGVAGADGKPAVTNNDFSLVYTGGDVPVISVTGKSLDASASYGNGGSHILADFPAMKLDMNIDNVYLVPDSAFTNVVGNLYCTAERCESAQFTANAGKDTIKAGITNNAGVRQFLATAHDAGTMLKDLDITDRMTGGTFEMRGTYDDKKSPPQLNSHILFTDFTLKNSQILGRIFSIGSLTGLQNAMTGSGISFDKFSAGLIQRAGMVTVIKGIASGNSIGITIDGTLDTTSTTMNFKGTLAPAYAINSILSKIPVIGYIAGGDQGLIAFNYSVKGTYAQPDVGVNPLSGLTPGFLRGIFGVFDDKPSKPQDVDTSDPKPQDAKPKTGKTPAAGTTNPISAVTKR